MVIENGMYNSYLCIILLCLLFVDFEVWLYNKGLILSKERADICPHFLKCGL